MAEHPLRFKSFELHVLDTDDGAESFERTTEVCFAHTTTEGTPVMLVGDTGFEGTALLRLFYELEHAVTANRPALKNFHEWLIENGQERETVYRFYRTEVTDESHLATMIGSYRYRVELGELALRVDLIAGVRYVAHTAGLAEHLGAHAGAVAVEAVRLLRAQAALDALNQ
jgi:hypothetical protein